MKKLIYIILLSYSVNCYSQSFELEYKIDFQRKLSEKLTEEFKANKSGDLARAEIFTYENPKAEFYTLKFNNEFSELTYIEALNNNQEKSHLQVSNFPLGKKNYRKINDTLIYNEHKINNQTLFSADTLICKYWNKTGKDSIILDLKVSQIKLENSAAKITAWFTEELPAGMGVYNLSFKDGFILAFEIDYFPNDAFKKNIIKVYPYKMKNIKRKKKQSLKFPSIDKIYTLEEIKEKYKEKNKIINQPQHTE